MEEGVMVTVSTYLAEFGHMLAFCFTKKAFDTGMRT